MRSVSTQPRMEVSGVRSSWETELMNSFFIFSVSSRPSAILLMVPRRRSTSSRSSPVTGRRMSSSPRAMPAAVRSTCPSGTTMLRTKYRPDMMVKASTAAPMMRATTTVRLSCSSTSVRLVTRRMAATSSAA